MKPAKGFSLLELLITLAIAAILLGISLPSFKKIIERNQIAANMNSLHNVFHFARSSALDKNQRVNICGSNSQSTCDKFWAQNILVFIDENDDNKPDADEIIHIRPFNLRNGKYKSRMSFGGSHTQFLTDGRATGGGTVIYCPNDSEASKYRRMTWNRVGRVYRGSDSNGDGVVEDLEGKELNCH